MSNEKMKNIIGGSLAGTAEAIITWPFENLKTQMQFQGNQQNIRQTAVGFHRFFFLIFRKLFRDFMRMITPKIIYRLKILLEIQI